MINLDGVIENLETAVEVFNAAGKDKIAEENALKILQKANKKLEATIKSIEDGMKDA